MTEASLLSRLFLPIHARTVVTGGGSGIGRSVAAGYVTGEVMIVDGGLKLVAFPVPRVSHRRCA